MTFPPVAHGHSFTWPGWLPLATSHLETGAPPPTLHWLHSVWMCLTVQRVALAEFCTFWPLVACRFLQQPCSQWALRTHSVLPHRGGLWLHSQSVQSSFLPSPVHELQGGESGDFLPSSLICRKIPWVALSSCLGDAFFSWCGYFCLVLLFFLLPCYFYSLLHFYKGFCWAWFPDSSRGETPTDAVSHPSQHSPPQALAWWAYLLSTLCPGNIIL